MKLLNNLEIMVIVEVLIERKSPYRAHAVQFLIRVFFKRFFRKYTEIANIAIALILAREEHLFFRKISFCGFLMLGYTAAIF